MEERKTIFAIHPGRHKQVPANFDLAGLAAAADGFSGSEIEQSISSGLHVAFAQKCALATELLTKELARTYALSVTMREKMDALRQWAHERAVPAN